MLLSLCEIFEPRWIIDDQLGWYAQIDEDYAEVGPHELLLGWKWTCIACYSKIRRCSRLSYVPNPHAAIAQSARASVPIRWHRPRQRWRATWWCASCLSNLKRKLSESKGAVDIESWFPPIEKKWRNGHTLAVFTAPAWDRRPSHMTK